jgi:hypothetical protein
MPTVEEVLRQSGFTDQQISEMDARAITAFTGVLSAAEAERQRAEQERQANVQFYDNQIVPSLTGWDEEKTRLENERARTNAEVAFYKAQNESARASGFIASDAPGYQPSRDSQGRYVSGVPGSTPGSPTFNVNEFAAKAGDAMGLIADIQWEHQHLFGKPLPISPTQLIAQADAVKLDPKTFASRTFNFDARRQELQKQEQEAHDNKIRADAVADNDRKWAEKIGSNPDIRRPMENARMTEVARAARTNPNLDPLNMNDAQRRAQTAQMIRAEIAERT